ncbi:uncharacterized protein H6S33_009552 [Morchella sextelata]|uniref:uncharacterized protein n=1 Tax=Morchella sextelata TaxID=1174677 RepID=UPI001D036DF8|nr:uncharacterized protein H6S33_009552 [Morchella sextelata]KAH0613172.1 hypothetical protein H6S33_009552 [Morchella sextelata]
MSSNSESEADKIRNKRLARLQAPSQPKSQAEDGESSFSPTKDLQPSISGPQSDTAPNPFTKLGLNQSSSATPKRTATSPPPDIRSPIKPTQSIPPSEALVPSSTSVGSLGPIELWEDKTLKHIYKVALEPGPRVTGYYILDDLRKDLEEQAVEGKPAHISVGTLDQLILSVCKDSGVTPMDYLVGCWRRASVIQRTTPPSRLDERKINILNTAKRLCINYGEYCITMPDIFENDRALAKLENRLLSDAEDDLGLPQEFLNDLVSRSEDNPDLVEYFQQAIQNLSSRLSKMNMSDNYKPFISALGRLAQFKPLVELMIKLPSFLPSPEQTPAHLVEKETILGPFFQLSPLQSQVCRTYFTGAKTKSQTALNDATRALRLSLQTIQDQLHQITMLIIRASPEARVKVLDFFALAINLNKKRGAIQVDQATVASDGFMLNITAVLNKLCEPFMDASFSKLDKIDIDYFKRNPRLDIGDETKINADEDTASEFYSKKIEGSNNFISEVFFLNVAAHHYGLGATEVNHDQLAKDIGDMEKHLERIQGERSRWVNTPQIGIWDRNIEKLRQRIDEGIAYKFALEVFLFDGLSQTRSLLFMRYLTTWLLRLVSPGHRYPQKMMSLPLPAEAPPEFSALPEYFIEDIGLCFGFVGRYLPECIVTTQVDELVIFCTTFLRTSTYIKKPNLKSKLVEILYYGISPYRGKTAGMLGDVINGHKFVLQHLLNALMNFYIEIERQYYEKFTVRYHISEIIKSIWPNPAYREKLDQESKLNVDFFIRFVALLLNDVTYVLDNSLTALAEINKLQHELESDAAASLSPQEKAEKEKALAKSERDATSYMSLGNETVTMLKLFTSAIPNAFIMPEIVNRLAGMLDYNLEALVGPKCNSLRVRSPEKYRFNPKALLSEITDVYLNLRHFTQFVEAVARDGRSYKPELFQKLQAVLEKNSLKGTPDIAALAKLAAMVEETKRREEEGEEELGEIPDDFLDPLMATLMEDPVILPSSKVSIDRQTIKVHLLSDPKDPFNREPLKIEDVIPNTELKEQIEAWIKERRAGNSMNADIMDVDG